MPRKVLFSVDSVFNYLLMASLGIKYLLSCPHFQKPLWFFYLFYYNRILITEVYGFLPSWTEIKCLFKTSLNEKFASQMLQWYGLFSSWTNIIWYFKLFFWENLLSLKRFLSCVNSHMSLNDMIWSHKVHIFFPSWIAEMWTVKSFFWE